VDVELTSLNNGSAIARSRAHGRPSRSPRYSRVAAGLERSVTALVRALIAAAPAAPIAAVAGALWLGAPAAQARRIVRVAAQVTLHGPRDGTRLLAGVAGVTFSGSVTPAEPGAIAVLQREDAATGGEWRRIGAAPVGSDGRYSITHTFLLVGQINVRVLVRGGRGYRPSPSQVRSYGIAQPQNPLLTINASTDPIFSGQRTIISGRVARSSRTAVTLLAHAVGHPGFAPVAKAVTDLAGKYRFPAQAPTVNIYYEVRGAGALSAELYEGVKGRLAGRAR
jgi:hypothetical protein